MLRIRCLFMLCAVIALGAACETQRSTLALDVTLEPAETPVTVVQIEVTHNGQAVVQRAFAWRPDSSNLGIFVPDGVVGKVQALGRGLDATGRTIATGETQGIVIAGGVSEPVELVLRATSVAQPDGGDPDTGTPYDGGASDDAVDAEADGASDAAETAEAADTGDAANTADAPDEGATAADGPPDVPADMAVATDGSADQLDAPTDVPPFGIVTPQGLGRYCSVLLDATRWAFAWSGNLIDDPCRYLTERHGPNVVQRAGLYDLFGINNAVARCYVGGAWIWQGVGVGDIPLKYVFDNAVGQGHTLCIFTAAPKDLPIFGSPFQGAPEIKHVTGVDFARPPYGTLNLAQDFGQVGGPTAASVVNNRAQDRTGLGFIDNHDGHDLNVPVGTPLVAVADGTVMAARFRDVTNDAGCANRASPTQGEVFIKHVVPGGTDTNLFDEVFVTYYAHVSTLLVAAGEQVRRGQLIAESGNTGCSTAPHLHFGVFRTSNTAGSLVHPFTINSNFAAGQDQNSSNGYQVVIDPYGFERGSGFDPWSWRALPWGALSINLWTPGLALPTGEW